jgi:hypothetical protein
VARPSNYSLRSARIEDGCPAAGVGAFGGLAFGDLAGEGGDHADAALVRGHHHAIGLVLAHVEDSHQDGDDELARRIVVVDQDHLIESRLFYLRLGDGIGFDVDIAHRPSPALLVDASSIVGLRCLQRLRQAAASFPAARSFGDGRRLGRRPSGHRKVRRLNQGHPFLEILVVSLASTAATDFRLPSREDGVRPKR